VDIHEYADRFELYIDVPGVDPGKVDLTLEGGVLTLSGERSAAAFGTPSDRPQSTRTERELGHFYRQFVLPDTVDGEGVNAVGKDGILTVTIPKHAKAMPRRIQVAA
jgi:HSP20 family protein